MPAKKSKPKAISKPAKKPAPIQKVAEFKVKPLGDRVLLREVEDVTTKTESGIYIPETANNDKGAKRGKVIAVGDGKYEDGKRVPMSLKPGDTVLFSWGENIEVDGEKYFIVRESEISAIIK